MVYILMIEVPLLIFSYFFQNFDFKDPKLWTWKKEVMHVLSKFDHDSVSWQCQATWYSDNTTRAAH